MQILILKQCSKIPTLQDSRATSFGTRLHRLKIEDTWTFSSRIYRYSDSVERLSAAYSSHAYTHRLLFAI